MIRTEIDDAIEQALKKKGHEFNHYDCVSFNERRCESVGLLVIHYTDINLQQTLDHFTTPAIEVSSHYTIDRSGNLHQTVSTGKRAWHAGRGEWRGIEDINSHSVGIDLEYIPNLHPNYTPDQYVTLEALCSELLNHFPIREDGVIGHEHVAIPRGRKPDPGPLFDWVRLYGALGIDTMPQELVRPT